MFNKEKFLVFLKKTKKKFKENKIELHPPRIKKDDYTSIKKCLNTNYISTALSQEYDLTNEMLIANINEDQTNQMQIISIHKKKKAKK